MQELSKTIFFNKIPDLHHFWLKYGFNDRKSLAFNKDNKYKDGDVQTFVKNLFF